MKPSLLLSFAFLFTLPTLCLSSAPPTALPLSPGWTASPPINDTTVSSIIPPGLRLRPFNFGFVRTQLHPVSANFTYLLSVYISAYLDSVHVPVWSANYNRPVDQHAVLIVETNHTLMLKDGDGTVVWYVTHVSSMDLQNSGNLVMYNYDGQVIWDSFNLPRDTLLPTQKLISGMKLGSQSGIYSAIMQADGMFFYASLSMAEPYLSFYVKQNRSSSKKCVDPPPAVAYLYLTSFKVERASCATLEISISGGTPDFLRLDDDGHFRAYSFQTIFNKNHSVSLFSVPVSLDNAVGMDQPTNGETTQRNPWELCLNPRVCGPYGICSPRNGSCTCLSSVQTSLELVDLPNGGLAKGTRSINLNQPGFDCSSAPPLQYNDGVNFIEVKNATTIFMLVNQSGSKENRLELEACKMACTSNSSCASVFYQHNTSVCMFSDTAVSLIDVNDHNYSAYLKISNRPRTSDNAFRRLRSYRALVITVPVGGLILVILIWLYIKREVLKANCSLLWKEEEIFTVLPSLAHRYTFNELRTMTRNFNKRLGSGGSGSVYEGVLGNGIRVAVKKVDGHLGHEHQQFLAEVATISGISHHNIVRLFGFCSEGSNRLLVYEYMENGSLDRWLFTSEATQCLDWSTRFGVALGTAQGLAYLHEECPEPIMHLDVKPENILIDARFTPKVSDFGLCKSLDKGGSPVMTVMRGTPGYMAPEWLLRSGVTTKSDVYSFGIVLLEIVWGKRIRDLYNSQTMACEKLQSWAEMKLHGWQMVEDNCFMAWREEEREQAKRMMKVGMLCIEEEPERRPWMGEVVQMLEGWIEVSNVELRR